MGSFGVILVAAGKGSRMKTAESKQYLPLNGKPVLVHTMELFDSMDEVSDIVIVTGEDDICRCREYADQYGIRKVGAVVAGGAERQHSVHEGLKSLKPGIDWVMVHDAVRPFASKASIAECCRQAVAHDAAVLAVPVKDTIKVVDADGVIQSTPDRRSLWAIQTPQAFRRSLLTAAHEQATAEGFVGTDDSMLVERFGVPVRVVESDYYNIKITTPEDLPWAEWIAANARIRASR
jgi:2-C-methyl-D-erythritol 4-phosphate cytidylyltransferase